MLRSSGCSDEMPRALKRRKVRRGTQNCWECKRRKTRCTFAVPTDSVCDGCKSRQVRCISQQFYEDGTDGADEATDAGNRSPSGIMPSGNRASSPLSDDHPDGMDEEMPRPSTTKRRSVRPRVRNLTDAAEMEIRVEAPNPVVSEARCASSGVGGKDRYSELCHSMLAVWPAQPDLDVMLSVPVSTSILLHGVICTPYSSLLTKDMPSAREILQLPPHNSHPVLIARKLLLLATYMQGIPRGSARHLGTNAASYLKTMSRLVDAARQVTSDDDVVGSLEGIECIMMESMYHNNAGNIRRAWITHRRAMVLAQMLGLHRHPSMTVKLPVLDAMTKSRIEPAHMWYRLIITDRYLSLMLGLPQCVTESPFGVPEALDSCAPLERLEHMESIAGGPIIQRNREGMHNLAKTQEIDKLLQEAAALMPPRWWLAPNAATIIGDGRETFGQTLRLMSQFTHYHLLAQLHLPYLLQYSGDEGKYDYNKLACIMASREILSRFVSFRGSDLVTAYCRGIDFLAFIASTVLSLAHIYARRGQRQDTSNGRSQGALSFLTHQRPGDRGLLEQTLQCMEEMSQDPPEGDRLASGIAHILQHLLAIEARAADGACYSTSVASEPSEPGEPGEVESQNDTSERLRIHIPYFGTIKIELGSATGPGHRLLELTQSPSTWSFPAENAGNDPTGFLSAGGDSSQTGIQYANIEPQATTSQLQTTEDTALDWNSAFSNFDHTSPATAGFLEPGPVVGLTIGPCRAWTWPYLTMSSEGCRNAAVIIRPHQAVASPTAPPVSNADIMSESWLRHP